jgi:hypothetical protein
MTISKMIFSGGLNKISLSERISIMAQKLLITFCIALYATGVPILEVNASHVFNPDWTPHARIHNVWQLLTNSGLGMLCLWLVWVREQVIIGAIVSALVTGSFLIAFTIRDSFGGSMKYLDGSEKTLFDINVGVLGFGLAVILLVVAILLEMRKLQQRA